MTNTFAEFHTEVVVTADCSKLLCLGTGELSVPALVDGGRPLVPGVEEEVARVKGSWAKSEDNEVVVEFGEDEYGAGKCKDGVQWTKIGDKHTDVQVWFIGFHDLQNWWCKWSLLQMLRGARKLNPDMFWCINRYSVPLA